MILTSSLLWLAALASVPTIQTTDFTVGRSWTWDYVDSNGKTYSTESYTVLAVRGDVVTFEMASSYDGNPVLTPHHRLEADVSKCLWAYSNPVQKKPWSIKMARLENGKWVAFDPGKTLAFEEKFNCNPHVMSKIGQPYLTVFSNVDGEDVFQQKLWRKLNGSWFATSGENRAIAIAKDFESDPKSSYRFSLRRP